MCHQPNVNRAGIWTRKKNTVVDLGDGLNQPLLRARVLRAHHMVRHFFRFTRSVLQLDIHLCSEQVVVLRLNIRYGDAGRLNGIRIIYTLLSGFSNHLRQSRN